MSNELNDYGKGCPFARQAIEKGKVLGPIKGNQKVVLSIIENWNNTYDVVVIEPHIWWENYGEWCIENEPHFATRDLTAIANVEKGFILVQKLTELVKVGEILRKTTDYYDNYGVLEWNQYFERLKLLDFVK